MLYTPDQQFYFSNTGFVNYRVVGSGKKTAIFIHGFGASNRTWDDIIPHLALPATTLILFDLIGAGFSSKPKSADYSMRANALVIESFIKERNLCDYALVGHSFGGGVCLRTTLDFLGGRSRPSALVLLDAAAYETKLPFFVEQLRVPLLSNVVLAVTPSDFLARRTLEKLYFDKAKVTQEKVDRYSFFMSAKGYNNALIETARQIVLEDFLHCAGRFKKITVPTLVLWGRHDNAVPLEDGIKLSKDIPTARIVIIEDSGHNIQEEQPKAVARSISRFLGGVWGWTPSECDTCDGVELGR